PDAWRAALHEETGRASSCCCCNFDSARRSVASTPGATGRRVHPPFLLERTPRPEEQAPVFFVAAMLLGGARDEGLLCGLIYVQPAIAEPCANRAAEAFFLPVKNVRGQDGFERFFQDVFGDAVAQFVSGRDAPDEIDQLDVEERRTYFESMRH